MNKVLKFNYDYASCMVMKLGMSHPEKGQPGKSHVLMTFSEALEYIKKIDFLTQGITKIYYLVGWQYLGHDDKYPDFFEVNEALKRPQDKTAADSLNWLYEEAKKYHSVISMHINFNDVYEDAPSFHDFVKAGALIRKKNGTLHAIETYNGKPCYKTCHKKYWESGLFKRQIDRLIDTFPFLVQAGTVHVDNFQCYRNYAPDVSVKEMQNARRSMIKYVHEKGIDITSEFTYKEDESLSNRPVFGLPREHHKKAPMDTLGLIPMSWWCYRMTRRELVETPPSLYCGGMFRSNHIGKFLYGNMHGEDIVKKDNPNWAADFLYHFTTEQLPYHFLCAHKKLAIKGVGRTERCIFSDNIISYRKNRKITCNGAVLKEKDTLFLPLIQKEKHWIAYSQKGDHRFWPVFEKNAVKASVYQISENGNEFIKEIPIKNGEIEITLEPQKALLLLFKK